MSDVWVFGYGSLVWRPDFPFAESRIATIEGWERRFWQGSTDHRGVPDAPGRVVTLVEAPGAVCWGRAYLIGASSRDEVTQMLKNI
jgi:cation transport protein ChaC